VPVKTLTQQDIQGLHRILERYVKARTSIDNQLRGLVGDKAARSKDKKGAWYFLPKKH